MKINKVLFKIFVLSSISVFPIINLQSPSSKQVNYNWNQTNETKFDLSTLSGTSLNETFSELPTDNTLLRAFFDQWGATIDGTYYNQVYVNNDTANNKFSVIAYDWAPNLQGSKIDITYVVNITPLVDLASVLTNIQLSTDLDNPFIDTPTKNQLLQRIKAKNPSVDLNQIDVELNTVYWDQTRVFDPSSSYRGSYKVTVKPKIGSNVYTQTSTVDTFYIQQRIDLSTITPNDVLLGRFTSSNDIFNALRQNNIEPTKITSFKKTSTRNDASFAFSIDSISSPYYYGEISMNFTYDSVGFTKSYSELNATDGWSGWTAGNMNFYLVDPNNNYVECMDKNFTGSRVPTLYGQDVKIGSTIVNDDVTYTIIGTAYGNADCGGLGSSQGISTLSGSVTIPSTMLYASRNFLRAQYNVTNLIIPVDSQLESFGECSLMGCGNILTLDIPATVTTILYGFFSAYQATSSHLSNTTTIYLRSSTMIDAYDLTNGFYILFNPNQTSYTDHFVKGTKGTKDGIVYVPANLVDIYRANKDWQAMLADINMIQPIE